MAGRRSATYSHDAIAALYLSGSTRTAVAEAIGCSLSLVKHVVASRGIAQGRKSRPKPVFNHDEIAARHIAGGQLRDIAADLGCHHTLVNYVARTRDLPRRRHLEHAATHAQWVQQYGGRK